MVPVLASIPSIKAPVRGSFTEAVKGVPILANLAPISRAQPTGTKDVHSRRELAYGRTHGDVLVAQERRGILKVPITVADSDSAVATQGIPWEDLEFLYR